MDITNIYGLHLGCRVYVEEFSHRGKFNKFPETGIIKAVKKGSVDGKVIIYWTRSGKLTGEPYKDSDFCSMAETLWLASHGYDVGIVPREYVKIVKPAKDTK